MDSRLHHDVDKNGTIPTHTADVDRKQLDHSSWSNSTTLRGQLLYHESSLGNWYHGLLICAHQTCRHIATMTMYVMIKSMNLAIWWHRSGTWPSPSFFSLSSKVKMQSRKRRWRGSRDILIPPTLTCTSVLESCYSNLHRYIEGSLHLKLHSKCNLNLTPVSARLLYLPYTHTI